jgi:transposase
LRRCGCQEAAARPNCLIAGKAYDVDRLRTWPKARHIEAAMSLIAPRTGPSPPEPAAYRRRNLVERLFGRLKNGRRIVTRYDRLARSDLAGSALIAVVTEWTL